MAQSNVIKTLEKKDKPLAVSEISKILGEDKKKISKSLKRLLKFKEVGFEEIDRFEAMEKYNCKHRMKLWFAVKGFFCAVVDLNTKKIYGCKKGSLTYLHEEGHIHFNNTEFGAKISYYQYAFMMMAVFFGSIALLENWFPMKVLTFINALSMVICYILEEAYCWGYAFKKSGKWDE